MTNLVVGPDPKREVLNWQIEATVEKYDEGQVPGVDEPFEVVKQKGNILLNAGITRLLNLLVGAGGTAYNNTNCRIGVGDSSTAESAAQTDLQAASNKRYEMMDATYPSVSGQTATFRATFGSGVANYAWNEYVIDNGSSAGTTGTAPALNRKVASLGTKASGSTWVLTITLTIS